jgi:hypothetical protein
MYFLAAARMDRKYRAMAMVGSSYDRDYIISLQRDHAAHNVPGFSYTYCKLGNKTLLLQPGPGGQRREETTCGRTDYLMELA